MSKQVTMTRSNITIEKHVRYIVYFLLLHLADYTYHTTPSTTRTN